MHSAAASIPFGVSSYDAVVMMTPRGLKGVQERRRKLRNRSIGRTPFTPLLPATVSPGNLPYCAKMFDGILFGMTVALLAP